MSDDGANEVEQALVDEALENQPEITPMGPLVIGRAVEPVPDGDGSIFQVKNLEDLPAMIVVVATGYETNRELIDRVAGFEEQLERESNKKKPSAAVMMNARAQAAQIIHSEVISVGDVLFVNRFAGNALPGSMFMAIHRQDVYGKAHDIEVKLVEVQGRWDRAADEATDRPTEPLIAVP